MSRTLAALLTCHNRRDATLACLEALHAQQGVDLALTPVVVDAGSSDGTADAIASAYPDAVVLRRGPELFWNGGMRVAFDWARSQGFDDYLWLNDDTRLDPDALASLYATRDALPADPPTIVAAATRDPETGALTYGGVQRTSRLRRTAFHRLPVSDVPRPAETMNGNCVLISTAVAERVGNLDPAFTHHLGDFDYGLRARAAGCEVWIAPGTLGVCAKNPARPDRTLGQEWGAITGPKELPPKEWLVFTRRWAGPLWPAFFLSPYVQRLLAAAARWRPRRPERPR